MSACRHNLHYIDVHSQHAFTTCIRKTHYINVHSQHIYAQHACANFQLDRGTSDSAHAHVVNHGQRKDGGVLSPDTGG